MAPSHSTEIKEFDTIVVGSGLAGLTAAYHASKYGKVAIITKSQLDISNSYYAQGGIAVVTDNDDSFESHIQDTLVAGRGLCDLRCGRNSGYRRTDLCSGIIRLGMQFDKENGEICPWPGRRAQPPANPAFRWRCYRERTYQFYAENGSGTRKYHRFRIYYGCQNSSQSKSGLSGVQAFDFVSGKNVIFKSKATIIATGGLSRIYDRSTNPHTATGDGIALAYDAGAKLSDIEFIQFHPSALYIPGEDAFLISEAVRGEGAWLTESER